VADTHNPSYSRGRGQEDAVWNQSWQIVRETQSQKNPPQNRADGVTQDVGPEFKPQYHKKIIASVISKIMWYIMNIE
jgi:hypothetical protein